MAGKDSFRNITPWRDPGRYGLTETLKGLAAEIPAGASVLDAGAGQCEYADLFAHAKYYSCDFGKGEGAWDYSMTSCFCDLKACCFREGSFDYVVCTQVLEHVPEPWAVMDELYRVLKPGGTLYLTAPFNGFKEHQAPYDFYRYTRYGLEYLARRSGFAETSTRPVGGFFWMMSIFVMEMHRHLFPGRSPFWLKALRLPFKPLFSLFKKAVARLFFYMDRYDRDKEFCLNYLLTCRK
ncbi:MAG: methyltransferase domain-containing protein [Nitrospirae bacterium]|nr:methyltransferase domain-containing protein [Nitrospirota bacterium]MBI5694790.1 methyltransferase domain-containing protein [Nitrospirota bacterium]